VTVPCHFPAAFRAGALLRGRLLLLLLLLPGCAHRQETYLRRFEGTVVEKPDADPLIRIGRSSVVTVEALDASGRMRGFGTGFLVGPNVIATCLHVVESAQQIRVVFADSSTRRVEAVHGVDPLMDLAVLAFEGGPASFPVLPLAAAFPAAGETVTALASPRHLTVSATRGKILASQDLSGSLYNDAILLAVPASPGFSGGPVLDQYGAVVGMMSEIRMQATTSTLVAVPVAEVRRFLESPALPRAEWLQRNPQPPPDASQMVAQAELLGLSNPVASQRLLDGALKIYPRYPRAVARKAALLLRTGRPILAEEAYRRLEELEPELVATRLERSICYFRARMPERGLELAEELARLRPESPAALGWLATCRFGMRDRMGAIEAARRSRQIAPHQFIPNFVAGCIWVGLGCDEPARACLEEATRLQPKAGHAWLRLGMVQWRSGRTNEAEACLQKALEDPGLGNPAPAHYLLCLVEWGRGNPKAARRAFGAFLQAELTRTDLENPFRSDLGVELVETQAHAAYRHLREKNWDRLETHQQISEILIRTKADDLLRPVLETVVRLQPDSADFWTKLAVMANATGDFERAQEASRRALALKPNHAYAHWALGFSQCALGEWEAGRKSLENATVLEGRAGAALEALAALEEVQGNHPAALRVLAAARKVFPGAVPPNRLGFVIPDARAIRIEAIRDLRGF